MHQIKAERVVKIYADVTCMDREFRVYPNGAVTMWNDVFGCWTDYENYEFYHDEIQTAGLAAINI